MRRFRIPASDRLRYYSGVVPAARPLVLADRLLAAAAPVCVVLCPRLADARGLLATVPRFAGLARGDAAGAALSWAILPPPPLDDADDPLPERLREELECDRLAALTLLANFAASPPPGERLVVITTPDGLFAPAPPRHELARAEVRLRAGARVDFNHLRERLASDLDYDAEALCERPGQFALRGGLIDVYPLNENAPIRLDFFGDELESIRAFDPTTQRSLERRAEVTIAARGAGASAAVEAAVPGYFGAAVDWLLVEPAALVEEVPSRFETFEKSRDQRVTIATLHDGRADKPDTWTALAELETDPGCIDTAATPLPLAIGSLEPWRPQPLESALGVEHLEEETTARRAFFQQLAEWQAAGPLTLIGLASTAGKADEIRAMLDGMGFGGLAVRFLTGDVPEGFLVDAPPRGWFQWMDTPAGARLAIISEREWLGRHVARRPVHRQRLLPHRARVDALLDFADLVDGDYLVHLSHGICRYRGLARMRIRGRDEEVISVEFADQVTLHVPLQDAHLLTRYVGLSRIHPRLGKLGGNLWDKTRAAAERATLDFAAEMLQLQARRAHGPGHAFSVDSDWQRAFENAFPFTETPDQAEAITETKRDMEQPRPMDRLVCGDVGFGKTEVAIRAAFKAVMDGFQAAVMVPTTVLAQQHFDTFRERFAPYPFSVEMLSRFRSAAQQKQIIGELAAGRIDLVIGTHRLLSQDVRFARLGLLVIDEEHRFGVRHKERLKRFKEEVDVLSMSATPIPRTLYLALMGARDLSVIETPPADRLPIETLVRSYDPVLVKRAIERELERGGQVFYLHNRVETIDSVAAGLGELVPDARLDVGHGQMPEHQLERVMTRFVAGRTDILVCTTIIENGLDIPNCNTIIIEGADRFGLSQLYQLRGRVGRFKRQAYAYLLLHRHGHMLDLARKRLTAMRQHNQLGAGFRIAMRDLELRGAGNLLGHQQSGHIAGVGFDLYCQLLRQSIQRLKGEPVAARIRANVALDFIREGRAGEAAGHRAETGFGALHDEEIAATRIDPVSARLSGEYLPETRLRIDFYRQLAMADSLDSLAGIEAALRDRFGPPPEAVVRLLAVTRIRVRAEMAGIRSVETEGNRLKCLPAKAAKGEYLKQAGRFPRLTGKTADLRLREIEHFLQRQCPTTPQ
jgi:transcription-repair coupling factor (superfamily II helicase)